MTEFISATTPVARKEHKCLVCGETIKIGEKYSRQSGKTDGEFYDICLCNFCDNLVDAYAKTYGESEWNFDDIGEFAYNGCVDCEHGPQRDADCEYNMFRCPYIHKALKAWENK